MAVIPIAPTPAGTVNISVGAASARVQVSAGGNMQSVRVYNDGTATAWYNWGGSTVTAALASGIPLAAGGCEVVTVDSNGAGALYFAAIAAGSTGSIYFTPCAYGTL